MCLPRRAIVWILVLFSVVLIEGAAITLPRATAQAASAPPGCAILSNPEARENMSGAGLMALQLKCSPPVSAVVPPPQNNVVIPGGSPPSALSFGPANVLTNNRATDGFPNVTQSETSVAVSGNIVLVGFNDSAQFGITGNFTGYSRSTDGGATFTDMGAPTTPLGGIANVFGDPVLVADRNRAMGQNGVFYFANLADETGGRSVISVHRSNDGGVTWVSAATASPLAGTNDFQDKEWMAVDTRASGAGAGNVYVCWRQFGGSDGIQFSRSTDGGMTFTQLASNLSSGTTNTQGCQVVVSPVDGSVNVMWVQGSTQRTRRSTDAGVTFSPEVTIASFSNPTTAINCGGQTRGTFLDTEAGANSRAIRSQVFAGMAINPVNGHLYAVWHAAGLVGGAGADIAFTRSTDNGATWSAPVRINPTVTGDQFFPAIGVTAGGRVGVIYYSTENSPTNRLIDLYEVKSDDGGMTWSGALRVTDVSFDRPVTNANFDTFIAACYMGDYNAIFAAAPGLGNNDFHIAWGDNRLDADPVAMGVQPDPDIRYAGLRQTMQLTFTMTAAPSVASGGNLVYTFTITNSGTVPYTSSTLGVKFPAKLSPNGTTTTQGSCGVTQGGQQLSCNIGVLAPGAVVTVTHTGKVLASPGTTLNATGTLNASGLDANGGIVTVTRILSTSTLVTAP
jgi:hypothetical protein